MGTRAQYWYQIVSIFGTIEVMATNLRLSAAAAAALRDEARRRGRSQQDLLREAVDRFLGRAPEGGGTEQPALARAIAAGLVRPPAPYRDVVPTIELPQGDTSHGLLDRDDR